LSRQKVLNTPYKWTWHTRARVWIFGMGEELLLGTNDGLINTGESYRVERLFPAGEEIPKGENDAVHNVAVNSTEFFMCMEKTDEDIANDLKHMRASAKYALAPTQTFWLESTGFDSYRVAYACRQRTQMIDILALRSRLINPDRGRLFVALSSHRMKKNRELIEKDL